MTLVRIAFDLTLIMIVFLLGVLRCVFFIIAITTCFTIASLSRYSGCFKFLIVLMNRIIASTLIPSNCLQGSNYSCCSHPSCFYTNLMLLSSPSLILLVSYSRPNLLVASYYFSFSISGHLIVLFSFLFAFFLIHIVVPVAVRVRILMFALVLILTLTPITISLVRVGIILLLSCD